MKEQFEKLIYNWVKQNFGEDEADDPSWNIKALANELNEHFYELYQQQELEYLKEEVENYVDGLNVYELTEQQMYNVADKIRNSDWYCSVNVEDMEWYIKRELETAKEKGEEQ